MGSHIAAYPLKADYTVNLHTYEAAHLLCRGLWVSFQSDTEKMVIKVKAF